MVQMQLLIGITAVIHIKEVRTCFRCSSLIWITAVIHITTTAAADTLVLWERASRCTPRSVAAISTSSLKLELAVALDNLATCLNDQDKLVEAEAIYRKVCLQHSNHERPPSKL